MSDYRDDVLVDIEWLKQHLDDAHLRILDVRAGDPRLPFGYRMGHVPGAVALNVGRDFFVYGNGAPRLALADAIAHALARCGIANDTQVVIYDETTEQTAAIAFWVLRYVGHREVKILNGGWMAWSNDSGAVTRDAPKVTPAPYHASLDDATRATAEWIQENAERPDVLLLDARSPGEYAMAHIPGAVNLPYEFSLDPRTQTYKDAATLRAQLERVGAAPGKEIVVYCHIGSRASHLYATLQALGYPRVRNYDGSMADWFELRGLPVE